ncbi:transcription/translation regulatory transformer protein RfaH [Cobetia marina]|uniref:transcription/translation regulatory transformer protein RfaH n=1 Tax=Cobetia marina TaxID=28258 RepID=UPI002547E067|nr:transcription/translation regulatory transformer protein RfaH [Cobetia pacifica]MDI6003920.1 transcription/translation regulatory transformer protein RfaH [Cobetia pacifica]
MSEVRDAAKAHWYLIQCKGGESFRAAENLTNQGFHVFHPLLEVERKRGSKLRWVEEPLFPYYLFIRLDQVDDNWRPIRSTRGVLKLVSFGTTPTPVPTSLVEALIANGEQRQEQPAENLYFRAGEQVEIIDGPLSSLSGVFESAKGDERVVVLLNLINQQQRVELSSRQLRRRES